MAEPKQHEPGNASCECKTCIPSGAEWRTPVELFNFWYDRYEFTLDAAATHENRLCPAYLTREHDSLSPNTVWEGERIWLNPPYGRGLLKWLERAYKEAQTGKLVCLLLPVKTDTKFWNNFVMAGLSVRVNCESGPVVNSFDWREPSGLEHKVIFYKKRLKFNGGKTPGRFASAIVIFDGRTKKVG